MGAQAGRVRRRRGAAGGVLRTVGSAWPRLWSASRAALPAALTVAGFVLLSAAAWTLATAAGLAAAGASCLLLEYLTHEEPTHLEDRA